jgi:RNA polymerase sigma factor for flagellar operon FliA
MAKPKNAAAREDQAAVNHARWMAYAKRPTPELRETLILQYTPLVKFVIGRMAIGLPAIMDYDDIFSVGIVGLIEALERYDPTKGVKFETYAISRIRGAIIDSLRKADRLSRTARQNMRQVEEATEALRVKLGREPSNREVAATIGRVVDHGVAGWPAGRQRRGRRLPGGGDAARSVETGRTAATGAP